MWGELPLYTHCYTGMGPLYYCYHCTHAVDDVCSGAADTVSKNKTVLTDGWMYGWMRL